MDMNQKQAALIAVLQQQNQPAGLSELIALLPPGEYAERTVRRWMTNWVKDGRVARTGHGRSTRYQAAHVEGEPSGEKTAVANNSFSDTSLQAITYVREPLFRRKPVTYNQQWFDSYQPNQTQYFSDQQAEQLTRWGQRAASQQTAGTYARKIYNRLLIDLAYNSSRLEGNTYSLVDTERLLVEGTGVEGKLDEEKVMILNHKEAIRHLVDNARRVESSYNQICTLHYLLADGLVPPQYAGKVRDHGVRIGASTYAPLEDTKRLDKQLRAIAEKAAQIGNPFEQSIFLLAHVGYLQAFTDVNKRTSRLSANIALIKNNLVPLSFNVIEKDDYASAMIAIYELNDLQPLIELYTISYRYSCQQYDATAESLGFDEIRVRYRQQRRDLIRVIITDRLIDEAMDGYIHTQAAAMIPVEPLADFIEDVWEDLNEISPTRIAGLGITLGQLQLWLKLRG
jgi:Fic family protein